ncbi:MAG: hypothetical protein ACRDPC_02980 [Solirubrobacteraceae bacterium]
MSAPARVLVVANRTADSEEVHTALLERSLQGPIDVTLLAPAAWEVVDPHGGEQSARRRLSSALTRLGAAGITARGVVGDADPLVAVQDIWDAERFDEVIVATLPQHLSRWLHLDLPHRVERFAGRPTRHVIASERSTSTIDVRFDAPPAAGDPRGGPAP